MEIEVKKISEACCHTLLHLLTGASHQVKSFLPEDAIVKNWVDSYPLFQLSTL